MKLFRSDKLKICGGLLLLNACSLLSYSQKSGINIANMDKTADPKQDFYAFCNGSWQKSFVLPESDSRYGSFNEINDNNLKKIKLILDAAQKNTAAAPNSNAQKLRDFYTTAMDSAKADKLGEDPIKDQLRRIDSVKTLADMMKLKFDFENIGINLFYTSYVAPDLKNSRKNRFHIVQGGLGLGDKEYYVSEKYAEIRGEYATYLEELLYFSGIPNESLQKYSRDIITVETSLAENSLSKVELRDIERQYNVYTPQKLSELTRSINWADYFKSKKIKQPDTVIVGMPEYLGKMDELFQKYDIGILKTYARAQLLMEAAPYLSKRFVRVHFHFRGTVLSGAKKMKSRWQRVQGVMNGCMGDIVAQEFVKKYFPADAKAKLNKLIDNLVIAYRERIASRDWMGEETKKAANRKLDLLIRKVGYPDKWKDYTGLEVKRDSYWANVCRANRFLMQDNLGDLKKPVDRNKWQMTAVTVNAYYDPTTNEITFPAAILQPPFYDPTADDAANYGTMGSIIGHELTHGFDDQGSQFDADGNMKMWWSEADLANFKARTKLIVEQFNRYVAIDTLHVNGNMTQGENIADLGGLTMAYYAYKKSLGGAPSPSIDGFTGEQRFFIAWAQGWKSTTRNEELKRLLTVDYHSPAYFRAFAPLSNMKEFYEAFGVKEGDKMFTPAGKRVEIW